MASLYRSAYTRVNTSEQDILAGDASTASIPNEIACMKWAVTSCPDAPVIGMVGSSRAYYIS